MKSLHIRNLDEATLHGLKRRARRHHRSLQKEVESLLSDAARMLPTETATASRLELHKVAIKATGPQRSQDWSRESIYGGDGR